MNFFLIVDSSRKKKGNLETVEFLLMLSMYWKDLNIGSVTDLF